MKRACLILALINLCCVLAYAHPSKVVLRSGESIAEVNKKQNTALDHRNTQAENDVAKEKLALKRMNLLEHLLWDISRQKEHKRLEGLASPFAKSGDERFELTTNPVGPFKSAFTPEPYKSKIEGMQFLKPSTLSTQQKF